VQTPSCKLYRFKELISQNNLCQTWLAVRHSSGASCLVKTLVEDSSLDSASAQSVLLESYQCQRQLVSPRIVTARSRHGEAGRSFIEYPLVDRTRYRPLTPELLWSRFDDVFSQVCVITDYLHSLHLVHCDLKLDNFLVDLSSDRPRVILIDLDFLCRGNTDPEARVLGTPDHIAPEILNNSRILIQSDNYSLGVSLREFMRLAPESIEVPAGRREAVGRLVEQLTQVECLHRPRFLIEFVAGQALFEADMIDHMRREALGMVLLTHFRKSRHGLGKAERLAGMLRLRANVFGPSDELLSELAAAYAANKRAAFRLFRRLLSEACVSRQVDCWVLTWPDNSLESVYAALSEVTGREYAEGKARQVSADEAFALAQRLEAKGRLEQAYLRLRDAYHQVSGGEDTERQRLMCRKLAQLAQVINRFDEAETHWSNLIELSAPGADERIEAFGKMIYYSLDRGKLDDAARFSERGRAESGPDRRDFHTLTLRRMEGLIAMDRNDYDNALRQLSDLFQDAVEAGQFEVAVQANYHVSAVYCLQGRMEDFRKHLEDAVRLAERTGVLDRSVLVISVLAGAYASVAEYDKAIELSRQAIRTITSPDQRRVLAHAYGILTWSYTRTAEFQKAEHWLHLWLNVISPSQINNSLRGFYNTLGGLRAQQGRLTEADDAWHKVLELTPAGSTDVTTANTLKYMAEWAFYRANLPAFLEATGNARDMCRRMGDETSLFQLDLYDGLYQYHYGESRDLDVLLSGIAKLIERRWYYDAALGLFPLLVESSSGGRRRLLQTALPLRDILRRSRCPIFQATELILAQMESPDGGPRIPATVWKRAFTILLTCGPHFYAMLVALKISESYQDESRYTNARTFLDQAYRLADALGNQHFLGLISRRLRKFASAADDYARLVDSFKAISEVLRNIGDYGETARRLVQFAVDQSGAERGVLLLKNRQAPGFHVLASVDCDDASLMDISDFSTNIPAISLEDLEPLVVDNALTDERTRKYKSIACHNIMSVTCVPLRDGQDAIGALYLDHHTIPALFSKQDVAYIQSVANFISIALTTVQDYRNIGLRNLQLKHELERLGGESQFLTVDTHTRTMLEKVPEIARTSGPVLILGESGTGKEPLACLIHKLSPRAEQPYVTLNCSAIPATMIEAELFGHAKGAFTDARDDRAGRFEDASGGTLFLDEIGDMPLDAQPKVLRVLDGQDFYRVGGNRLVHVDSRFIAATNRNLDRMVQNGSFRSDLFYRINRFVLEIPPLRDRPDDIPMLLHHFLSQRFRAESPGKFSLPATTQILLSYRWPGNVRELINLVERCCILHPGRRIEPHMLPPDMQTVTGDGSPSREHLRQLEVTRFKEALKRADGNQSKAARSLGIPLTTFRRKLRARRTQLHN
jgi:transcriptional regulator with GAF, ATPase, and Fis domain